MSIVLKEETFQVGFEGIERGFFSVRNAKVIPCRGAKDRKGMGMDLHSIS